MLLKRLLLCCAMRQLLVKQSTVVRNGSEKEKFRDCYAFQHFSTLLELWGARSCNFFEKKYICVCIRQSRSQIGWVNDIVILCSSFEYNAVCKEDVIILCEIDDE